jgi:flagellin-like hook-associated protein FlgL
MFVAVMVVLTLAGCGGSTTATPTPTPSPSESSLISRLAALKAYKAQVQPIVTQLTATATSLPTAVKGLSTRPDSTWTASAANLTVIAAELGDEAASLEALIPPAALADVQAAAVTAIQNVQAALTKTADALNKGVVTSATKVAAIQSQMESLKTQISGLSEKVTSALDSVTP